MGIGCFIVVFTKTIHHIHRASGVHKIYFEIPHLQSNLKIDFNTSVGPRAFNLQDSYIDSVKQNYI